MFRSHRSCFYITFDSMQPLYYQHVQVFGFWWGNRRNLIFVNFCLPRTQRANFRYFGKSRRIIKKSVKIIKKHYTFDLNRIECDLQYRKQWYLCALAWVYTWWKKHWKKSKIPIFRSTYILEKRHQIHWFFNWILPKLNNMSKIRKISKYELGTSSWPRASIPPWICSIS